MPCVLPEPECPDCCLSHGRARGKGWAAQAQVIARGPVSLRITWSGIEICGGKSGPLSGRRGTDRR